MRKLVAFRTFFFKFIAGMLLGCVRYQAIQSLSDTIFFFIMAIWLMI